MIACLHPPFPALVAVYALVGLGCGAKQAAWNSFVGGMHRANELLGLLHGFYGLGATITPVIASILITRRGWQWFQFYYILAGMAAVDILVSLTVFATQSGRVFKEESRNTHPTSPPVQNEISVLPSQPPMTRNSLSCVSAALGGAKSNSTLSCLSNRVVLLCSAYLLAYVGSEVALGGWLITFMMEVRGGSAVESGIVSSGMWAGITLGRVCLGFVTGRFFKTEKHAVAVYLVMAMIVELLFWLVPNFVAGAVSAAFLGVSSSRSRLQTHSFR